MRAGPGMLRGVVAVAIACLGASAPGAIFVAQEAAGSGDGTSCANARAVSWFNTAGNWGPGADQIHPGNPVSLCGTITGDLVIQASGASGDPVVIDGTGATVASSIVEIEKRWWRVQNVTYAAGLDVALIEIRGGGDGVFSGCSAQDFAGDPAVWIAQSNGLPANITIRDNDIRTTSADLGDTQHDIIKTEGSHDVIVEGNYLEMRVSGGAPYNNAHDDVIQAYEKGGSSAGNPYSWTIRHNFIVMNSTVANHRSWTMVENMGGDCFIYDNVFLGLRGAEAANGIAFTINDGATLVAYGNTIIAKNGSPNNTVRLDGGTRTFRNNLVWNDASTADYSGPGMTRDHNLWFGPNIPSCAAETGSICGEDPLLRGYEANDFAPLPGSPALGAGANLGAPYDQAILPGATWPGPALVARPAAGAWTIGAYAPGGADDVPPAAPGNLLVHP